MNKIFRNGLFMLAASAVAVSCADYNDIDNFTAQPDPTFVEPYKDYKEVKSYIDRDKYPNMTLGATLRVAEFNKQELAHAAAITNFDNLSFGTTLMSGAIVNAKGVMNFLDFKDLLDHVDELGAEVFGSPLAANTSQADDWVKTLTSPIEIKVPYMEDANIDYSKVNKFEGQGSASIVKFEGDNILQVGKRKKAYVAEWNDLDTLGTYSVTIRLRSKDDNKDGAFYAYFCSKTRMKQADGKNMVDVRYSVPGGKWVTVKIEDMPVPSGATEGFFQIDVDPNVELLVSTVKVGHYPDNHRPQTAQEVNDTIHYALQAWCDGLMKINKGRIKLFDLIEDAIDTKGETADGYYDLKTSANSSQIYWQDALGNENYAPVVAKYAREAFEKYEGDPAELKFFISESDLTNEKKLESLKHWISIWDAKGANIEGISAKFSSSFSYYEDPEKQQAQVAAVDKMLENLATTGKLIRLSNFDIKYTDIEGNSVSAQDITEEQRQNLANYYGYIIKSYMNKIPADKQAGICKGNLADTADPVGLWSVESKSRDWVRTATYKAFCDALSGK